MKKIPRLTSPRATQPPLLGDVQELTEGEPVDAHDQMGGMGSSPGHPGVGGQAAHGGRGRGLSEAHLDVCFSLSGYDASLRLNKQ